MHRFTSTSNPAPIPKHQGTTSIVQAVALAQQESPQKKIQSHISVFESFHTEYKKIISELHPLIQEHEKNQSEFVSRNENFWKLSKIHSAITTEITNSYLRHFLTPSNHSKEIPHGESNASALIKRIMNDPRICNLDNQISIEHKNIQKADEKISAIQLGMTALLKNKEMLKIGLDNSRIELLRTIDALKAAGAVNDSGLKLLVSIAHQKIAAADFSEKSQDVAEARHNVIYFQCLLDYSSMKMQLVLNQLEFHRTTFEKSNGDFANRVKQQINFNRDEYQAAFLADPKNKKIHDDWMNSMSSYENEDRKHAVLKACVPEAKRLLPEATEKLHQSELILKDANSAVENAQRALDQSLTDTDLPLAIDKAASPGEPFVPPTDDSLATDADTVHVPVTEIGSSNSFEPA